VLFILTIKVWNSKPTVAIISKFASFGFVARVVKEDFPTPIFLISLLNYFLQFFNFTNFLKAIFLDKISHIGILVED